MNPKPGDTVVLIGVPPGLLGGLPSEDQTAIVEAAGKPVLLVGYEDGRAELEFTDDHGTIHSIWVHPKLHPGCFIARNFKKPTAGVARLTE